MNPIGTASGRLAFLETFIDMVARPVVFPVRRALFRYALLAVLLGLWATGCWLVVLDTVGEGLSPYNLWLFGAILGGPFSFWAANGYPQEPLYIVNIALPLAAVALGLVTCRLRVTRLAGYAAIAWWSLWGALFPYTDPCDRHDLGLQTGRYEGAWVIAEGEATSARFERLCNGLSKISIKDVRDSDGNRTGQVLFIADGVEYYCERGSGDSLNFGERPAFLTEEVIGGERIYPQVGYCVLTRRFDRLQLSFGVVIDEGTGWSGPGSGFLYYRQTL